MTQITTQADSNKIYIQGNNKVPQTLKSVTATGGSTTTIEGCSGSTADQYVGGLALCIKASNKENLGQKRFIKQYTTPGGTLTTDPFRAAVVSGDVFVLIQTGIALFAEDTGGTDVTDASRTEPQDYFNGSANQGGPYLEALEADNNSGVYLITDFGSGVASVTLDGNSVIGDIYAPVVFDEGILEISEENKEVLREAQLGALGSIGRTPITARGVSVKYDGYIRGSGTAAGDGVTALRPSIGWLLRSGMTERLIPGNAISSNSTPTTIMIPIDDGASSSYRVGDMLCINSEPREITAIASHQTDDAGMTYYDALTVSPALSTAPETTDIAYGCAEYYAAMGETNLVALSGYSGDFEEKVAYGVALNPTITFTMGEAVKVALEGKGLGIYERPATRVNDIIPPSVAPLAADHCVLMIGGTNIEFSSVEFKPSITHAVRTASQCIDGAYDQHTVKDEPVMTVTALWDSNTFAMQYDRFTSKKYDVLMYVNGVPGNPGQLALLSKDVQIKGSFTKQDDLYYVQFELSTTHLLSRGSGYPRWQIAIF